MSVGFIPRIPTAFPQREGGGKGCSLAAGEQVRADGSGGTWGAGLITHLLLQLGESLYLLRTLGALCGKELLQSRAYLGGTGAVG